MPPENVAYTAIPGWERHLASELSRNGGSREIGPGIWEAPAPGDVAGAPVWFQNLWDQPETLRFRSVSEAAKQLRERNGLWVESLPVHFRRGLLIKELLPRFRPKPLAFPAPLPSGKIGGWTLLDENTLLCSRSTFSPFPGGEARFSAPLETPPSSAYLKLQEALTLMRYFSGFFPEPGNRCLDAGACPGGWSWVLAQLGCNVLAVDRSPLDEGFSRYRHIVYQSGDGFKITPSRVKREGWEPFDWVFSDMAAFPAKVLDWVRLWLEEPHPPRMVITLKMQGEPDWDSIRAFQAIPRAKLIHLHHNKHELTFLFPAR